VIQLKTPVVFSEKDPVPIPPEFTLQVDDIFVFPMEINDENLLPFGMGKVINHAQEKRIHPFPVDEQFSSKPQC
jgi:hypothetical protein